MPTTKIYLIPGLVLDGSIFQKLDLPGHDVNWLQWIEPESMRESLQSYAQRMVAKVDASGSDVILGGHSFGGIMALEMARLMPVEKAWHFMMYQRAAEGSELIVSALDEK